jgi:hypothetical protein
LDTSDTQHAFGRAFAAIAGEHLTINHSEREYARDDVYASTADGFGSLLERAKFGVWHRFSEQHVQRYVDEVAFRWSNRIRAEVKSKNGKRRRITKLVPVLFQFKSPIDAGIGRRMRRTSNYGFRTFRVTGPATA